MEVYALACRMTVRRLLIAGDEGLPQRRTIVVLRFSDMPQRFVSAGDCLHLLLCPELQTDDFAGHERCFPYLDRFFVFVEGDESRVRAMTR